VNNVIEEENFYKLYEIVDLNWKPVSFTVDCYDIITLLQSLIRTSVWIMTYECVIPYSTYRGGNWLVSHHNIAVISESDHWTRYPYSVVPYFALILFTKYLR
jgi:hypothetical protein